MIRTTHTLPGSALAVSALVIAAAALAFEAGAQVCPHAPAHPAPITRTTS